MPCSAGNRPFGGYHSQCRQAAWQAVSQYIQSIRRRSVAFKGDGELHQVACMSMKGDTCMDLGTSWPAGSNRKVTRAPQGVFVTSAMHALRPPPAAALSLHAMFAGARCTG